MSEREERCRVCNVTLAHPPTGRPRVICKDRACARADKARRAREARRRGFDLAFNMPEEADPLPPGWVADG